MHNQHVCDRHGGKAGQNLAMAARRGAEAALFKANQLFGIPRQVDPTQGLIEEYWRRAGLVAAYEQLVAGIPMDELTWAVVERTSIARGGQQPAVVDADGLTGDAGGNGAGPENLPEATTELRVVRKVGVNIWLVLFNEERDRYAKLGVEIVRLGLEARRDEYIRAQVEVFASVLLSPELALTPGQRAAAGRLLRGLGARDTTVIDGQVQP